MSLHGSHLALHGYHLCRVKVTCLHCLDHSLFNGDKLILHNLEFLLIVPYSIVKFRKSGSSGGVDGRHIGLKCGGCVIVRCSW